MMEILWAVVWLASFAGYMWYAAERLRIPAACAPLAAMSFLTLGMYAGGMLRLLEPAAWLLMLAGAALFVCMLRRRSVALIRMEMLVFALGCAALWLRYRASLLVAYDDFSHWGMIVRHMLTHDRLPEAQDALITFQSYPPGAACWLYYACRFLGGSDGMMLTAQAAMTLAGWLPLLALVKGPGRMVKTAAAGAAALVGLSLFQGTASLMVDNLIASLAVGALCLLLAKPNSPWLAGMMAALLALVKDSGLFFAAIIVLCSAWGMLRARSNGRIRRLAKLCVLPVLARAAWLARITWAFPAADVSRHALTVENLRATGADKSYADMLDIGRRLLGRVFSMDNQAIQILLILLLCMAAAVLVRGLRTGCWQARAQLALWAACALAYAAWVGFLWLMYVFSMTLGNALQLVAFERYNSTCALFLYGVLVIWLCTVRLEASGWAAACLALAALLPLTVSSWTAGMPRLFQENYFVPLRERMEALYQTYAPADGEKAVVLVAPEDDSVYADYMARYTFQSPQAEAASDAAYVQAQVYYAACAGEPVLPEGARIVRLPGGYTQED